MEIIDFEQRVSQKIRLNSAMPGFPQREDFGVTKEEVDGYLFDKQAILDSVGSLRSQYTLSGVLIILPVVVLSAFPEKELPWGSWSLFVALAIGFLLAGGARLVVRWRVKRKLRRMANERIEQYIKAVLGFGA